MWPDRTAMDRFIKPWETGVTAKRSALVHGISLAKPDPNPM